MLRSAHTDSDEVDNGSVRGAWRLFNTDDASFRDEREEDLPSPMANSVPSAWYPISNCRVTAAVSIPMLSSLPSLSSFTYSILLETG